MSETVDITRYPNRRLYDRSRKAYVTLGDIEEIVLSGRDIRVRDSKSEEDLTRVILTQIILERHPERMRMFPVAFLHNILRADQISLDWMTAYLGQAKSIMDAFPGAIGPSLVPGGKFWRSIIPGGANRDPTHPPPSGDAENPSVPERSHDPEGSGGEQLSGGSPGHNEVDLAKKLAEMEQRLKQLEGGSTDD